MTEYRVPPTGYRRQQVTENLSQATGTWEPTTGRTIDDTDRLRHCPTDRAFGGVHAPSALGTFTHGHNRQLHRVHHDYGAPGLPTRRSIRRSASSGDRRGLLSGGVGSVANRSPASQTGAMILWTVKRAGFAPWPR